VPSPVVPESFPTETEQAEQAEQARPITDQQRKMLHALLRQADLTDREEIRGLIEYWTGEQVETSNALTRRGASTCIQRLEEMIRDNESPEGGDGDDDAAERPA